MNYKKIDIEQNIVFDEIETNICNLRSAYNGINLLDNYNHRTYRVSLKIKEIWKDFELMPGRNKSDAKSDSLCLKNIEIKTTNVKSKKINNNSFFKKKYMFDKQDRQGRREYIFTVDALVFSVFCNEKLHWIFWSKNYLVLKEYKKLCKNKQEEFKVKFEEIQNKKGNNGGYDTITISLSEFSDESIWNVYVNNSIYIDIKMFDIKKILEIQN